MASPSMPLVGKVAGMKSATKGLAKPAPKMAAKKPTPKTSMTIDGAIDVSGDKFPAVPAKKGPTLPADDSFAKMRTQQT
jgi:hypothetical protein